MNIMSDLDYSWILGEAEGPTENNQNEENQPDYSWILSEETELHKTQSEHSTIDPDYLWILACEDINRHNSERSEQPEQSTSQKKVNNPHGCIGKHILYPQIVSLAKSYIENHGYTAHAKRHNEIASCGVTGPQLQTHLQEQIPGLTISLSTCRRLLLAPRKNSKSASYYKGLIQARRAPKSNRQPSKIHMDLHFSRAQVNYINELMWYYQNESLQYSVDNKNKVNVGTLAISRYHHIGAFFPTKDMPDYPDHDFPLEKFKIIPSGYMRLERSRQSQHVRCTSPQPVRSSHQDTKTVRARSLSPVRSRQEVQTESDLHMYRHDSHNRLHINFPKTGRLHVYNRAMKFHSSTIETHANDLTELLLFDINAEKKHAVSITCDNGPDWNFKSPLTQLYMGRIWRDLNLDYLVLVSFAPGHSAENMIEHAWAPLGKFLVGVTLPATLPGENKPPCRQSGLSAEQKQQKEAKVLDAAIDQLNGFWDKSFNGYPITSKKVPCFESMSTKKYNDYNTVKAFFDAGIKKRSESADFKRIEAENQVLMKHCTKTTYCLQFTKCQSSSCTHCKNHPLQARSLMSCLQKFGRSMFSPTASASVPGSYSTFLELAFSPLCKEVSFLDQECPSVKERAQHKAVKCNEGGCKYIFSSAADAKRHETLVHGSKTTKKRTNAERKTESRKRSKTRL